MEPERVLGDKLKTFAVVGGGLGTQGSCTWWVIYHTKPVAQLTIDGHPRVVRFG